MARFFGRRRNQAEEDFRRFEQEIYLSSSSHSPSQGHYQPEEEPFFGPTASGPVLSPHPQHFSQGDYHPNLRGASSSHPSGLASPSFHAKQNTSPYLENHQRHSYPKGYYPSSDQGELKGLGFWQGEQNEAHEDHPDSWGESTSPFKFVFALAGLVAMLTIIWFGYRWLSQSHSEGIPLIQAESSPFKVRPENPGGAVIPYQDKLIYGRISPESEAPVERLLPPPEQPAPLPEHQLYQQNYQGQAQVQQQSVPSPSAHAQQPPYPSDQPMAYPQGGVVHPGTPPIYPASPQTPSSPAPYGQPFQPQIQPSAPAPTASPQVPQQNSLPVTTASPQQSQTYPQNYAPPPSLQAPAQLPTAPPPLPPVPAAVSAPQPAANLASTGPASPSKNVETSSFYVQLGTLPTENAAKQEIDRIMRKNRQELEDYDGFVRISETADGKKAYRALIGPFRTRNAALSKCNKLGSTCRVVQIP